MRSAVVGSAAVIAGRPISAEAQAAAAKAPPPKVNVSPELDVVNAFLDKIATAMLNIVKAGLSAPIATLPGPIKLKTKASEVYKRAMDDSFERQRGVGIVAAYALAGSEENARGHLVVTAPTGGSAGVIPAIVYALGEGGRKLPQVSGYAVNFVRLTREQQMDVINRTFHGR